MPNTEENPSKLTESTKKPIKRAPKKESLVAAEAQIKKEFKRNYKGEQEIDHDLFELLLINTRKNESFHPLTVQDDGSDNGNWVNKPHKHFYHTFDSDGRAQKRSSPTAGHYHDVEWEVVDGEMVARCGPPKVISSGKVYPYKNDKHTHEAVYKGSERIKVRAYSTIAKESMAALVKDEMAAQQGAAGMVG